MTALRAVDYKTLQLKEQSHVHSLYDPLSVKVGMSMKVRHRKMSSLQIDSI